MTAKELTAKMNALDVVQNCLQQGIFSGRLAVSLAQAQAWVLNEYNQTQALLNTEAQRIEALLEEKKPEAKPEVAA